MPEDQKPFVHQDGTSTPAAGHTPLETLLSPTSLQNQIAWLRRERTSRASVILTLMRTHSLDPDVGDNYLVAYEYAIETLQLLQEPRTNALLLSMARMTPDQQTLVADIVLAIATPDSGRQQLMNDLRKRIEGRS